MPRTMNTARTVKNSTRKSTPAERNAASLKEQILLTNTHLNRLQEYLLLIVPRLSLDFSLRYEATQFLVAIADYTKRINLLTTQMPRQE